MAQDVETGHIFKKKGTHGTPQDALIYNKYMVATLLFNDPARLINFLPQNTITFRAYEMLQQNIKWIESKRAEYRKKIIIDEMVLFEKLGLDYRVNNITPDLIRDEANGIYSKEDNQYNRHYTKSPYLKVWDKVAENISADDHVVDVGCGPGQFMDFILDKGISVYTGIDISPVAIGRACQILSKRRDQHKASLICANALNGFNLPEADKYVMVEILEHLNQDKYLIGKIPSGKEVILSVPSYLGGSHVRKFDTPEEVLARYGEVISDAKVTTLPYGTGKIHVLTGTKT